jgi:hypothetical protein
MPMLMKKSPSSRPRKGFDLCLDLVAVLRIGEQHAGEERAKRHRDAGKLH